MSAIYPIASTRVSDLLTRTRLLARLQASQLEALRLQDQLSTGYRISRPSEDAPAALRAMGLQRVLEQKEQVRVNLNTSNSYLSATETALASVSQLLADVRGLAVSAVDSSTGVAERAAAVEQIDRAIQQLATIGNQKFRGRYLFSGSGADIQPFRMIDEAVAYDGNAASLYSYADTGLLFETNVSGDAAFGAISAGVRAAVDWNPILTSETRLADLHGGLGVRRGSFVLSDSVSKSTIDISSAETIGDVVRLIESNPPAGRQVTVRISADHLEISLDEGGGGSLTIREAGGGSVAAELGILQESGVGTGPIIGDDLDPRLRLTTNLSNVFGVRSRAIVQSSGSDNNIVLEAHDRGDEYNGVRIQFVDDSLLQAAPGLSRGSETTAYSETAVAARAALTLSGLNNNLLLTANTAGAGLNNVQIEIVDAGAIGNAAQVVFDANANVLTIGIDTADGTQVQTLINTINSQGTFTAVYDNSDPADGGFVPGAAVLTADAGVVSGNTGNSGGEPRTIFVNIEAGASTADDVVAALQADADVAAMFDVRLDEKDALLSETGGGLPVDATAAVTAGGAGVEFDQASGLRIVQGSDTYTVSFQDAETVEDVLNALNGAGANVLAEINEEGTGINVRSRLSGVDFHIGENGGATATELGIRTFTTDTFLAELNHGFGVETAAGADFTIRRNDGVELEIDISSAATIGDVIDLINSHPDNLDPNTAVIARLTDVGNGIELVDDNPVGAAQLTVIRTFGSHAAWDLGLVTRGESEASSSVSAASASAAASFPAPNDLNTALLLTAAEPGSAMNGVEIEFQDTLAGDVASAVFDAVGRRLIISIDASQTTANTVAAAVTAEGTFSAALDVSTDPTNDGSGVVGAVGVVATTSGGAPERLVGEDVHPLETEGVFNSLSRLSAALTDFDLGQVERALEMLEDDLSRLDFARGEVGARQQSLDFVQRRLDGEETQLRSALSLEIDVDLAAAISDLTARQAAIEVSLRLMGQVFQLSLLDFL